MSTYKLFDILYTELLNMECYCLIFFWNLFVQCSVKLCDLETSIGTYKVL